MEGLGISFRFRGSNYGSFQALVNDTRDNLITPPPIIGDIFGVTKGGGVDANGARVDDNALVVYDGVNWLVLQTADPSEQELEAAKLFAAKVGELDKSGDLTEAQSEFLSSRIMNTFSLGRQ